MEEGIVALYQKCVHLGCKVPWCATSQWFECPCHGSKYNRVGEKQGGPAPRGLDRFVVTVAGDKLTIDTGVVDHRPADRHRHHRPGRRGTALRRLSTTPATTREPTVGPAGLEEANVILALTFRTILVIINVVAVAVIVGVIGVQGAQRPARAEREVRRRTSRRSSTTRSSRTSHLERVLRWALLFSTIVAVVLPRLLGARARTARPPRPRGSRSGRSSGARCSSPTSHAETYDNTKSLLCANCHGTDAGGGSALYTITPDAQGNTQGGAGAGDLAGAGAQHRDVPLQRLHRPRTSPRWRRTAPGPRTR